jgi:hypothetical protein
MDLEVIDGTNQHSRGVRPAWKAAGEVSPLWLSRRTPRWPAMTIPVKKQLLPRHVSSATIATPAREPWVGVLP